MTANRQSSTWFNILSNAPNQPPGWFSNHETTGDNGPTYWWLFCCSELLKELFFWAAQTERAVPAVSSVFLALQQISSPWWTVGSLTAGRPVTNHQDSISRAPPGTVTPVTGTPVTGTPVTPIASLGLGRKNCSTFLSCQAIRYLSYVSKKAKERRELGGFIS